MSMVLEELTLAFHRLSDEDPDEDEVGTGGGGLKETPDASPDALDAESLEDLGAAEGDADDEEEEEM
jgi:hypothetical protein